MITPSFGLTATERVLPRLALDFTTASLDNRVTFTRSGATATKVNASGLIESVAADTPRFDYTLVTGGVCKGLLIEEARTNLAFHSSNVLAGNWAQYLYNGASVDAYTVTNGSTNTIGPGNANYFVATATPLSIAARQESLSLASGSTITCSAYIYVPSQSGFMDWRMDNNYSGDYAVGVVQNQFDTWVRVSNTTTLTGARTQVDFDILMGNGGTPTAGFNFYATNFQIEVGAFATSYIPTTTTSVTRNADVVTMTGTNFSDWFNASEGTFAADATTLSPLGGTQRIFSASTGSFADSISASTSGTDLYCQCFTAGNLEANMFFAGGASNTTFSLCYAYKTDNAASAFKAGSVLTDTSITLPAPNQLGIGNEGGFTLFNGWINNIRYWPQRLIDAEVQAFSK